jgi:hypothetical protein
MSCPADVFPNPLNLLKYDCKYCVEALWYWFYPNELMVYV